jgi:hypothetical protein
MQDDDKEIAPFQDAKPGGNPHPIMDVAFRRYE